MPPQVLCLGKENLSDVLHNRSALGRASLGDAHWLTNCPSRHFISLKGHSYQSSWNKNVQTTMANTRKTHFETLFSMKKAVPLINAIDTGRFPRLLSRILQKLHLKVCISVFPWLVTSLILWNIMLVYGELWEILFSNGFLETLDLWKFGDILWSEAWETLYSVNN